MNYNNALTPKQNEMEQLIEDNNVTGILAEALRCLNNSNERLKDEQRYAGNHYSQHLIDCNELVIHELKTYKAYNRQP